jgi:hypothetical protein
MWAVETERAKAAFFEVDSQHTRYFIDKTQHKKGRNRVGKHLLCKLGIHQLGEPWYRVEGSCEQARTCGRCGHVQDTGTVHQYGPRVPGSSGSKVRDCKRCGDRLDRQNPSPTSYHSERAVTETKVDTTAQERDKQMEEAAVWILSQSNDSDRTGADIGSPGADLGTPGVEPFV